MGKSGDYSVKRTVLPLGRAINSLKKHRAVIPVQAEIQAKAQQTLTKYRLPKIGRWIPAFTGMTAQRFFG